MEVDGFVFYRVHAVMEQTLLHKDFIGKRGFNKLIAPFREEIEKRGWSLLCEHKPAGFCWVSTID